MGNVFKSLILCTITFSSSILACSNTEICVQEKVIPDTYKQGYAIVQAINHHSNIVIVNDHYSSKNQRFTMEQIGITTRCLKEICM